MHMINCINNFVDTMISEKATFEKLQNEVQNAENTVSNIISTMETKISAACVSLQNSGATDKDEAVLDIANSVSLNIRTFVENANKTLQESIKGMAFIQDFEKKFTVAVFGKVKAGKSYIGNFIMGNTLKECNISSSYDSLRPINVMVYDRGVKFQQDKLSTIEEKECVGEELKVGMTETTSTIQWFDIGGLSWFDTPGIGSVTWENEMLAKEYVKNSDLVIYACNSDAAGTTQDFAEMKQLVEMKKPILLLLTQSDTYDEDEDENGDIISVLVPKSKKDRNDQEQYMLSSIQEQGLTDVLKYADILTVSAKLANEALKTGDESQFESSNMEELLKKLTDITKNEAAQLKRNTPKDRINKLIADTSAQISEMAEKIDNLCASIEDKKSELEERRFSMVESIRNIARNKILILMSKYKAEIERTGGRINESTIIGEVEKAVNEAVTSVCVSELKTQEKYLLDINIKGIGDMKMKKDTISWEESEVVQKRRDPKGLIENVCSFFGKKYYENKVEHHTRTTSVNIGVNESDITANLLRQLDEIFKYEVDDFINNLICGYYMPIESLRKSIADISSNTLNDLNAAKIC